MTREIVEEFLRRTGQGDPARIAELYAAEVDWHVSWPVADHPAVPWIRPRSTRADVEDHYRTFPRHCPPGEAAVSVERVLVEGADAVVMGRSSQLVRATGRRFTMTFALHLTVRDGLLVRHHMYEDSLSVLAACEPDLTN